MTAGGGRGSSAPSGFPPAGCPLGWSSPPHWTPSSGEPRHPLPPRPSRCAPRPARADRGSQAVFSWATSDPPVGARYRLEWRFRSRPGDSEEHPQLRTAADRMKAAGIVQDGDPVLLRRAVPFRLPDEAGEAQAVIAELFAALQRAASSTSSARAWASPPRRSASPAPPRSSSRPTPAPSPSSCSTRTSSASRPRRRAVRGLPVLLRRPRPRSPPAAHRGRLHPPRRPAVHPRARQRHGPAGRTRDRPPQRAAVHQPHA